MRDWFKRLFLHSLVKYIVLINLGILIFFANLLFNGFEYYTFYVGGVQIAGLSLIFMGGLSMLGYYGAFDFWGYTFSKKTEDGRRIPVSDYTERKRVKRLNKNIPFTPYFLVGVTFLLVSFVMNLF